MGWWVSRATGLRMDAHGLPASLDVSPRIWSWRLLTVSHLPACQDRPVSVLLTQAL